jgi:hypothetical protein
MGGRRKFFLSRASSYGSGSLDSSIVGPERFGECATDILGRRHTDAHRPCYPAHRTSPNNGEGQ